MSWTDRAACRDEPKSTFFPERGASIEPALDFCRSCSVRDECLSEALALPYHHDVSGIRGGLSARARRQLRYPVEAAS